MKNLFLIFVAVSVLFVMGCQENTITDPLSAETIETQGATNETVDKDIPRDYQDHPNIIKFQKKLEPPFATFYNHTFEVGGAITFEHNLEYLNPPGPLYRVTVNLSVNAELKEEWLGGSARWAITGETKDLIYLTGNHSVILVKYFKIDGRSDGMELAIRFGIDKDEVVLIDLWLTSPDEYSVNNVAQ